MKKITLIIASIASISMAFTSCTKECQVCSKHPAADINVCRKDYNNQATYKLAIDNLEASGYNCK